MDQRREHAVMIKLCNPFSVSLDSHETKNPLKRYIKKQNKNVSSLLEHSYTLYLKALSIMPKKGTINLPTPQWTTSGRQCHVFGRRTKPTREEIFFSPMEIAGAANHSRDGENGTGPMQMAFPTPLKVYQSRFLKKDPVTSREDFNPINSVLNDGLMVRNS